MITYKFESYDSDSSTRTVVEFDTEQDTWSGYDGPVSRFMNFLRGCGYVFDINAELGVMNGEKFTGCNE